MKSGSVIRKLAMMGALVIPCGAAAAGFKFDFGPGQAPPGFTAVRPETGYESKAGFGFLPLAEAGKCRVFAMDAEEGNYDVTVTFGDPAAATSTTIKAESRRLMLGKVVTAEGEYKTRTFTVNVRRPGISTGGRVSIGEGEERLPDWDEKLTLEFNGGHQGVASLEMVPAKQAVTVFVAGDSTVTDQPREPYAGWAQMLPRFFRKGVAVSNHAWSGLSLFSFRSQRRLEKVLSMMREGDYLLIQFGHNDQKSKAPNAGPFTSYKSDLKQFVEAARGRGGIPVLVTPMERRRWRDGKPQPTLADFAEAVRQVGAEEKVPVIDLNAMSLRFYAAMGPDKSTEAFVHYPAKTFAGQDKALKDDSHHNAYGAYELARCVVEGIKTEVPKLAESLTGDAGDFDPAQPDAAEQVDIPVSPPTGPPDKPAGS